MNRRKRSIKTASKIHKRRMILRSAAFFLSIILVVLLAGFFTMDSRFLTKHVEVFGNETIPTEEIMGVVGSFAEGKHFWLFPKENVFLYPKKSIKTALEDSYLRFEKVDVYIGDFPNIAVQITERTNDYLWCDDVQGCFYVDRAGLLFKEAPNFSGDIFVKFYEGEVTKEDPLGSYVLPEAEFRSITRIFEETEKERIRFEEILVKQNKDLIMKTTDDWEIRASRETGGEDLLNRLNVSLASSALEGGSDLEYIDLRFGNKVFYKLK